MFACVRGILGQPHPWSTVKMTKGLRIIEVFLEGEESAADASSCVGYRLLKFAWAITQGDRIDAEPPATLMPYNYTTASVLKL